MDALGYGTKVSGEEAGRIAGRTKGAERRILRAPPRLPHRLRPRMCYLRGGRGRRLLDQLDEGGGRLRAREGVLAVDAEEGHAAHAAPRVAPRLLDHLVLVLLVLRKGQRRVAVQADLVRRLLEVVSR